MKQVALVFGFFFLLLGCYKPDVVDTETCTYTFPEGNEDHPKHEVYQDIMVKYRKKGLPGMTVLMEDENGIWVGSEGKADIENNVDFLPCHPSKAASITKMMVATLTFMLHEEGKLDIDDPIADYVDDKIIRNIKNADQVSIKNCLQHTTGIYDLITDGEFYLAVLNNPNKHWKAEELARYAFNRDPYFEANTDAKYSNTNTLLVSLVLDEVLGFSHAEALRNRIWCPLTMNDTYYQSREALPDYVAQGYYDLYNDGSIVNVSNLITGSGNGYGGVYSTVFDLRKFMRALYYDKTLIEEEHVEMMQEFEYVDEKLETGVGMLRRFKDVSDHAGVGHSGRDLGYSADLFAFPTSNDRLMIFFVNYGTDGDTHLRQIFWDFEAEMIRALVE